MGTVLLRLHPRWHPTWPGPAACCSQPGVGLLGQRGSCARRLEVSGAQLLEMRALVGAAWLWSVGAQRGCEAGTRAEGKPGSGFALCSHR